MAGLGRIMFHVTVPSYDTVPYPVSIDLFDCSDSVIFIVFIYNVQIGKSVKQNVLNDQGQGCAFSIR